MNGLNITSKAADAMENIAWAIVILLIGLLIIKILVAIERKALSKTKLDVALHTFIMNATKVFLGIILVITVLQTLGFTTSSLVAVLSAAGAAIALALRDSLSNVAGGFLIIVNKPFKRGDEIEINGSVTATGIVDDIDLMNIRLHTWDNKVVTVPNGVITNSVLVNYTVSGLRRLDRVFQVSYDSDIDKVKDVLRTVIEKDDIFYTIPEPIIGMKVMGDSSLSVDLKVWCNNQDYYTADYRLQEAVKKAFDQEGIEIPYPQVDIHNK